jgi:nucleotide-binding universal stress UspA family protein
MKKNGIICAIDVNDFDQDVIDLAATFAKQFKVDLDILHITLFPDPANAAWPAYLGSPNALIQDNRRLRKIKTNIAGVNVIRHHLSGHPPEKILAFVDRNEPQLLVLGTHGRTGLARIFGSIASKILRNANCPVMVLRQRQNSQDIVDLESKAL